jgi:sialate O-acetylesterase
VARGGALKTFVIAGSDLKFVPASARIEANTIVVSSPQIIAPVAVRYAWESYPEGCNLCNAAGLPAAPFRTDGG